VRTDFFFNAIAAQKYGVGEAVMLHHLVFWVHRNALNGENEIDGKIWTYNSVKAFRGIFPFWSRDQIRRLLISLEKKGGIESGCHNRMGFDRTKWFTITREACEIYELELPQHGFSETTKRIPRKRKLESAKSKEQYQVKTTNEKPQISLPWGDDAFRMKWDEWKAERKANRRPFKTLRAEEIALTQLFKKSGGDLAVAIDAIDEAIGNGWKGIFPERSKQKRGFDKSAIDLDTVNRRAHSWGGG